MKFFSKKIDEQKETENKLDTEFLEEDVLADNMIEKENSLTKHNALTQQNLQDMFMQAKENEVQLEVATKVKEIDRLYLEGVSKYSENIYLYNIEIDKVKTKISMQNKKIEKESQIVLLLDNEIKYESNLIDKYNNKFIEKVKSLDELRNEYSSIMEKSVYTEIFSRKKREVLELLDEVEELELTLLNKELARINAVEKLEPEENIILDLKKVLEDLELKKGYLESTGLSNVTNISLEKKSLPSFKDRNIVDTVIMEEK